MFIVSGESINLKEPGNDLYPSAPESFQRITFVHLTEDGACLPLRRVCGIGSTARANPHASIHLHLVPWKQSGSKKHRKFIRPGKVSNCATTKVLQQLNNVRIDVDLHPQLLLNDSR